MSASKTYTYNNTPFSSDRFTVVRMKDGKFLEVHRGTISWTAAFRAANPDVKPRVFNSLHEWHVRFHGLNHNNVSTWKMSRGWVAPLPAKEGETSYWLDSQLATFMGAASATEEQLSDAIMEFNEVYPESPFLTFLLGKNPYEVIADGDILGALEENGHILEKPVECQSILRWRLSSTPTLDLSHSTEFNFSPEMAFVMKNKTGSWENVLKVFRAFGYFNRSTFARMLKEAGIQESVEDTGYIYTDIDIRTFFGLDDGGKGFLSFSDFRRQMLGRGHLMPTTYSQTTPSLLVVDLNVATGERTCVAYAEEMDYESDDSDDSDYVPSDSESDDSDSDSDTDSSDSDTDSSDSDDSEDSYSEYSDESESSVSDSDMEIDEEATPAKKDTATLKKEALKLVADTLAYATRWQKEHSITFNLPKEIPTLPCVTPAQLSFKDVVFAEEIHSPMVDTNVAAPFAEIHAVFFRVQDELVSPDNACCYKARLATQFIEFCMRPSFTRLWRSSAFERLQMRATLQEWTECSFGEEFPTLVAAAKRFMASYPA